jgi:hypothetical protein
MKGKALGSKSKRACGERKMMINSNEKIREKHVKNRDFYIF